MCVAAYVLKLFFSEMKISAQEFFSDWELKLEMDGEMLSPKTAVPLVIAVDFFFKFLFFKCTSRQLPHSSVTAVLGSICSSTRAGRRFPLEQISIRKSQIEKSSSVYAIIPILTRIWRKDKFWFVISSSLSSWIIHKKKCRTETSSFIDFYIFWLLT